ncbi:cytochrome c maturation protein CcmE domain-containing protein [Xiamenia xianingshaonis]|uniref:Cytochrome c maturation protein CcmE n=1 Tax=Xiamenia xianingshaonis TaxID=2682776 RepID=A0A9E6MPJ2_9ACTN|nr:cytochrome c maturation protein CcmE [Xiamenia xianingshaonis]NHM14142.1 cytochrome c maturation protein CcmE [Xiamenia xianingshaonis]QTU84002.1 cytochrome c maturation protein CcmE [Xiamenia xianingshaonis]
MNTKTKRRMIAVTGVIVMVLIVVLAVVGGSSSATTVSVAEAATGDYAGQKIQVSGNVVDDSFETKDNVLTFAIYDPEGDGSQQVNVRYAGGVSATFGNGVTAICTGKLDENGVLNASELVTKCPSKYENASEALGVAQLLGYGEEVVGKPVKVTGFVEAGSLAAAGAGDERFVLVDPESGTTLPIAYEGALSDDIADEITLVVTGSIDEGGKFTATDVAIAE